FFKTKFLNKTGVINNGLWGVTSTVTQTIFMSLFFIIISKYYSTNDFAKFLIASTVYQLLVGFSSMGLGHWFIREYEQYSKNKITLMINFIKIQTLLGIIFYVVNVTLTFSLYSDKQIILLAIILGLNIIFDNAIYS